jgi:pimeloyl-ACP methyl ester carboxylesterase
MLRKTPSDICYETFECFHPQDDWLVLLMGAGGGRLSWPAPFIHELRNKINVITIDNRGTGQSSKPETMEPYSIRSMAKDTIQVLKEIPPQRILTNTLFNGKSKAIE